MLKPEPGLRILGDLSEARNFSPRSGMLATYMTQIEILVSLTGICRLSADLRTLCHGGDIDRSSGKKEKERERERERGARSPIPAPMHAHPFTLLSDDRIFISRLLRRHTEVVVDFFPPLFVLLVALSTLH